MAYNRFLGQNGFRGVDFTSHPSLVHPDRLADALNVWKDYKSGQGSAIETFPGFRKIAGANGEVYGIFRYRCGSNDYLLAHIGERLYYFDKIQMKLVPIGTDYAKLAKSKSQGFQFGDKYYVIDGKNYICISVEKDQQGKDLIKAEKAEEKAYIPTTFINGAEHEQRNMLVDKEVQKHFLDFSGSSASFEYEVIDENYCRVKKIVNFSKSENLTVTVPSVAVINGVEFPVKSIGESAFEGIETIQRVILPTTVTVIDIYAFKGCTNLTEIYCEGVKEIREFAFHSCSRLYNVYASSPSTDKKFGLSEIYAYAFYKSGMDKGDNPPYTNIYLKGMKTGTTPSITVSNNSEYITFKPCDKIEYPFIVSRIPIFSPALQALTVKIDGRPIQEYDKDGNYENNPDPYQSAYYSTETKYSWDGNKEYITFLLIHAYGNSALQGKTAEITLSIDSQKFYTSNYTPFLSAQSGYGGTAQEAILGCTICTHFDGRVFFTGNPDLPNTVFYTNRDDTGHNNPFYIGTYNYFDTGIGSTPNTAMIASGSYLYVFKGDTIQDGAINLYQGVDGTDNILPRFYVRQQGLAGVGCLGAACNFNDDPVFISRRGLDAVGMQTVNLERTVQHRSTNVDRKLTAETLSNAQLTEWEGYLVLLVPGGKVYLADSRQLFNNAAGYVEYEWYYLNGFGSYTEDEDAYAYSSVFPEGYGEQEGYSLYETPDAPVPERILLEKEGLDPVKSVAIDANNSIYYLQLEQDGKKYLVYKTGEKIGGTFSPATCIVGIEDYLIFGTENGDICVVNTDKRGTMEANEIGIDTRDIIPREYFSHMGHRYLSTIILALENAGVPNMAKNTVKRTVVLKAKDIFGSVFKWNVRTDRKVFGANPDVAMAKGEISNAVTDLDFLEFQYINFDTSYDGALIVLNEKKKRYVEKQYAFFSDGFCRPFGIYYIAYQYEIQGKVKNR